MQVIENKRINELVYIEKLSNGLTIITIPKKSQKKYISWGIKYGSIDNKFKISNEEEIVTVPDGIAHYLEHKLFEQSDGKNSLDILSSIGVDPNAYTTNNHTAYLYECTDNFFDALDEFMNYIQNPYFTDENVEKERGIIEQEIMMYADYPEWSLYMNAIKAMYKSHSINIDVAGSKESIAKITKDELYRIYNSFYTPNNMVITICGDFEPEQIIEEIKKRITLKPNNIEVKRIYDEEQKEVVKKRIEKNMDISMPCFLIGYKDTNLNDNIIKKDLAIDILFNIIIGKSSELYKRLYEKEMLTNDVDFNYEFGPNYSHVLIQGQSNFFDDVMKEIEQEIERVKEKGIDEDEFERTKRKIYGEYVKNYNDISTIGGLFVIYYFRNINPLDYFEEFESLSKEYVENILKEIFKEENKVISIINPLKEEKIG